MCSGVIPMYAGVMPYNKLDARFTPLCVLGPLTEGHQGLIKDSPASRIPRCFCYEPPKKTYAAGALYAPPRPGPANTRKAYRSVPALKACEVYDVTTTAYYEYCTPVPSPPRPSFVFSLLIGVTNQCHEFQGGLNCHQAAGRQALRRLWVIGRWSLRQKKRMVAMTS